ncbi:cobalamin biosynthesis protein CobD [Cyanobium sp. ATX 6E8]|uniref:adenosylcobinamide-phosphate synthase CbiB n=1 Tax=Cyanobium sp. ATX 6E8 TaxID=2823701 RepID=UPI0020CFBE52|nr:adenosylcobinamide-phosphate synthase CbiB [Cyanobium sp. ATX 6E8]MCP9941669.1 cobalamin biosynthesis protein CobD [Cyanobium sp. ATX 6E8]
MLAACGLDRLVGDPRWCLHPVVVMGWWITGLRRLAEAWAGDAPGKLRLAGALITLLLVGGSGLAGWCLEQLVRELATRGPVAAGLSLATLTFALASALAGRSLEQAVQQVLNRLPPDSVQRVQNPEAQNTSSPESLMAARQALAWIVGRDTNGLDRAEILRATAETASENAVDGLFAPLFWMLVGAGIGSLNPALPGPLALAWGFKAASTLDSMLGYRRGRLRWLGTAGARLDDLLVWLPCRLAALSLAVAAGHPGHCGALLAAALREGAADPSPNAGVSQAAYAHAAGVQLGGSNRYGGQIRSKPLLAKGLPPADADAVQRILALNRRLETLWLAIAGTMAAAVSFITKTLS